jgi:hypothetical protein
MNNKTVVENEENMSAEEMLEHIECLEKETKRCWRKMEELNPTKTIDELIKESIHEVKLPEIVKSMRVHKVKGINVSYRYDDPEHYHIELTKNQILEEIKDGLTSPDEYFSDYISNQLEIDEDEFTVYCDHTEFLKDVEEWVEEGDEKVRVWYEVTKNCETYLSNKELEDLLEKRDEQYMNTKWYGQCLVSDINELITEKYLNGSIEPEENYNGYEIVQSHIHIDQSTFC